MTANEPLSAEEKILADRLKAEWTGLEPPPELDRAILDRARVAVRPAHRRQPWLVGMATAAALVLTFGVIWRTMEVPPQDELYRPAAGPVMSAPPSSTAVGTGDAATAPPTDTNMPSANDDSSAQVEAVFMEPPQASRISAPPAPTQREEAGRISRGTMVQARDGVRRTQTAADEPAPAAAAPPPSAPPPPPAPLPEPVMQPAAPAAPIATEQAPQGKLADRARMTGSSAPQPATQSPRQEKSADPFPAERELDSTGEKRDVQLERETEDAAPPAAPVTGPSAAGQASSENVGRALGASPATARTNELNSGGTNPVQSNAESVSPLLGETAAVETALAQIRQLVRHGRKREALRAIAALRKQHPAFEMPEDVARFERIETDRR